MYHACLCNRQQQRRFACGVLVSVDTHQSCNVHQTLRFFCMSGCRMSCLRPCTASPTSLAAGLSCHRTSRLCFSEPSFCCCSATHAIRVLSCCLVIVAYMPAVVQGCLACQRTKLAALNCTCCIQVLPRGLCRESASSNLLLIFVYAPEHTTYPIPPTSSSVFRHVRSTRQHTHTIVLLHQR